MGSGAVPATVNPMLLIEAALLAVCLVAGTRVGGDDGLLGRVERRLRTVAVRPVLSLAVVAGAAVALRLALLPLLPWPRVVGRDESSLALLAETFLAGRLANPPHPFAAFFESVYVHQAPTYGSMYFPGRGFELALGLAVFGVAAAGATVVLAAAAAAAAWMVRGWLGQALGFAAGLLVVVKFLLFSALANEPVGHGAAFLGGALVVGALPRLAAAVAWRDAVLLAAGVALLAVTRPYEGMLLCLPVAAALAPRLAVLLRGGARREAFVLAAPAVVAVAAAIALLAAYDLAGTGRATLTPYDANRHDYAGTPAFIFQAAAAPARAAPEPLAGYYRLEGRAYFADRSPAGLARSIAAKFKNLWGFFIGPLLTIPFVAGLGWLRRQRVLVASLAISVLGFLPLQFSWPHYETPLASILLVTTMAGFARLRTAVRGRALSRALPAAITLGLAVPVASLATGRPALPNSVVASCCYLSTDDPRWRLDDRLAATPGRHLVFVRYRPTDSRWAQWVYNHADIDGERTIWAHDLGAARDAQLIARYPGRHVWLLDGLDPARLVPYPR